MTELIAHPVTPERWPDVAAVFGDEGGTKGCWCMSWRIPAGEYNSNGPEGNRAELERRVLDGRPMGMLVYRDGQAVGWCSLSPRPEFGRIERSTSLDILGAGDPRLWSIACFLVDPSARRSGVMRLLLESAVEEALRHGATAVEGYPSTREAASGKPGHNGSRRIFAEVGFTELGEPRGSRIVMRKNLSV